MSGVEIVVGIAARDAFLAGVTASQVDAVGGGQTFASSSYLTGGPVGAFGGTIIPDADVDTGSFSPTPLFSSLTSSISGVVVSATGTLVSPTSSAEAFSISFPTPLPSPNANEVVTVRVDAAKSGSNADSTFSSSVFLTASVKNGDTEVAARYFGPLTSSFESFTFQLTDAEKGVVSWNDFNVQCEYQLTVNSASLEIAGQAQYVEVNFFKSGIIEAAPKDETVWRIIYD